MQHYNENQTAKLSRRTFMGTSAAVATSFSSFVQTAMSDPQAIESTKNALAGPIDVELKKRSLPYLADLCDWVMSLQIGCGRLQNTKDTSWLVFIIGNLARVLLAGHKITGNASYLKECLRWCDTFTDQQRRVRTTNGGAFHALLHSITKDPQSAEIAAGAVRWMLSQIQADGRIPYIMDDKTSSSADICDGKRGSRYMAVTLDYDADDLLRDARRMFPDRRYSAVCFGQPTPPRQCRGRLIGMAFQFGEVVESGKE